jgi:hypothetical protein
VIVGNLFVIRRLLFGFSNALGLPRYGRGGLFSFS